MANSNTAIDLDDVLERVQNDTELLLELLDIFMEDYQKKYNQLKEFVPNKDFEQIRNISHSLKGAAGNISAKDFHHYFSAMEQYAVDNNFEGINEMMQNLQKSFPQLQESVEAIKAQYGSG